MLCYKSRVYKWENRPAQMKKVSVFLSGIFSEWMFYWKGE